MLATHVLQSATPKICDFEHTEYNMDFCQYILSDQSIDGKEAYFEGDSGNKVLW